MVAAIAAIVEQLPVSGTNQEPIGKRVLAALTFLLLYVGPHFLENYIYLVAPR